MALKVQFESTRWARLYEALDKGKACMRAGGDCWGMGASGASKASKSATSD